MYLLCFPELETVKKGTPLYGQPEWWGEEESDLNLGNECVKRMAIISPSNSVPKTSEYCQEIPQSQSNPRHLEEETQNTDNHTTARIQL